MKIRILESARKDLVDGYYFYEKQSAGIGSYFLESVYSDIDTLTDNAGIHPMYFGDLIMYAGLAMLTGDLAAVILAFLGAVAIVQQCKIGDRALSERFKAAHERWKSNTRLIVPFLL